jgi:hypothetical protein
MHRHGGVTALLPNWERLMRTRGLKAVFALLALNRKDNNPTDWNRVILIFSNCVTVGLITLYVFGKVTGRW